ncbi:GLPGLI family protein [Christiangramia sp. SM2212]|uniref:GLPGLI family protein n=1 Tax=Christiangramia sediminicola TaxID=3073267 RepID=A0ABU1EM44_9FLAO|nr:GLPGLI family protein [Christiangramia sp. SM2212]MDR5589059.1 GLPGLI family protein [Christiangramia sp. SM2212]
MKRYLILLFFSIASNLDLKAQKFKDNLDHKIIYKLTYVLDSTNFEKPESEFMILYTGDELSLFTSRAKSLANPIVVRGNSGHTSRSAVSQFQYELIKNREKNKIYYTQNIAGDWFLYEQNIDLFEWKISADTKSIKGYECQKATTSFKGRNYTAWFAPEIPISEGPYKFNGLPGLILEIADSEEEWNFQFVSLENLNPSKKYKINFAQYINTSEEKLMDVWKTYRSDPFGYVDNPNVKISPEIHKKYIEAFGKMLENENNPLELENE